MTIHRAIPPGEHMTVDALLRRIKDDIDTVKRRGCSHILKKLLAEELEDLGIETLASTPGALRQHPEYGTAVQAADWDRDPTNIVGIR